MAEVAGLARFQTLEPRFNVYSKFEFLYNILCMISDSQIQTELLVLNCTHTKIHDEGP